MKKVFKKLDSMGIEYQRDYFGASYFSCNGVPSISFEIASVTVDYDTHTAADMREIDRYCKRHGYTLIRWGGFPGYAWYKIARADDLAALRLYQNYADISADACNQAIHLRHIGAGYTAENESEFNDILRGIMDFYAAEYLAALKNQETGAA